MYFAFEVFLCLRKLKSLVKVLNLDKALYCVS